MWKTGSLALLLLAICGGTTASAQDACLETGGCPPCCPPVCEPYKATCHPCWEHETEDDYCWQVEKDYVCIPPVKFPWQKCCELGCPRIRKINTLKIYEFERDFCRFKWNLKKYYPCCDQDCVPHAEAAK